MLVLILSSNNDVAEKFGYENFGNTESCYDCKYGETVQVDGVRIFHSNNINNIHWIPDIVYFHNMKPYQLLSMQDILGWSSCSLMIAVTTSINRWCVWSNNTGQIALVK